MYYRDAMIRTKHIALLVLFCILILLAFLVRASVSHAPSVAHTGPQEGLMVRAMETSANPKAVVLGDTTRETSRKRLIEKLRSVVLADAPLEESATPSPTPAPTTDATPEVPHAKSCPSGSRVGDGAATWGAVDVTVVEGARVIATLLQNEHGLPYHSLQVSQDPRVTGAHVCLNEGMVGIALDGRVIEAQTPFRTSEEGLAGYALDGFGIYGSFENGKELTSRYLDECHGHVHPIVWDGVATSMYHYHVTPDEPYTLGCYRGTPSIVD